MSENQPDMSNRRSLNRIFVSPRSQMKYSFFLFGCGLTLMTIFFAYFMFTLNSTIKALSDVYQFDPEVTQTLQNSMLSAVLMTIAFSTVLTIISFMAGILMSHRIFGPMVPIRRHLKALIEGDYSSRLTLRKKDEFQDVAEDLNELAKVLDNRHGGLRNSNS